MFNMSSRVTFNLIESVLFAIFLHEVLKKKFEMEIFQVVIIISLLIFVIIIEMIKKRID